MEQISKEIDKMIRTANKSQDFDKLNELLESQISELKKANIICAFDMEFSDKKGDDITEIAFALYSKVNNKLFTEHLIISEQVGQYERTNTPVEHSKMFAYGESKTVPLEQAMKMLNHAMSSADTSVVYIPHNKQKHFEEHGFDNQGFVSFQDLLKMQKRNSNALSVSKAVDFFCEKEQPINNAGNDAVATLEIMSKTIGKEIGLENFVPQPVNDFSDDPRMKTGVQIRESRRVNNALEKDTKNKLEEKQSLSKRPKA